MSQLSSKDRVLRLLRKEPVDVMPCFSGMSLLTIQAIEKMGIRFAKVHTTAEYMADAALTSSRMFGFDSVVIPYDMCTVAEAMGRGLNLYENVDGILFPTVPTKWESLDEVDIPSDFMQKGRMPMVDQAYNKLIDESKDGEFAVGSWMLGPFTQAGQIIELDLLLKGVKKYKDKVEDFMNKMTDVTIEAAKHYEKLGVDYMTIREPGASADLLSPKMWKELIQPYLTKIIGEMSIPTILHICGNTDLIIELMNQCGADALSVDQTHDIPGTRQKLGNDVLIFGNFDPFGILVTNQDPDQVESAMKSCIDSGVDAVWPGCDVWPDMKKENIEAWVKTVKEYGKNPSPAVGRL